MAQLQERFFSSIISLPVHGDVRKSLHFLEGDESERAGSDEGRVEWAEVDMVMIRSEASGRMGRGEEMVVAAETHFCGFRKAFMHRVGFQTRSIVGCPRRLIIEVQVQASDVLSYANSNGRDFDITHTQWEEAVNFFPSQITNRFYQFLFPLEI